MTFCSFDREFGTIPKSVTYNLHLTCTVGWVLRDVTLTDCSLVNVMLECTGGALRGGASNCALARAGEHGRSPRSRYGGRGRDGGDLRV